MTRSFVPLLVSAAAFGFATAASAQLGPGEVYVGASKVNIAPRPNPVLGKHWEQNEANC